MVWTDTSFLSRLQNNHNNHNNPASDSSVTARKARFPLLEPRWSTCRCMATTAPHGGEGSDACAHGGDMSSRASQWPCPQPPTTALIRWRLVQSTTAYRHRRRAGEAANQALRRQKSKAAGDAVFFELFDEDTAGVRPEVLAEPAGTGPAAHTLTTHPEQVIEVPKIFPEDVLMRAVLRDPQLAEQLWKCRRSYPILG